MKGKETEIKESCGGQVIVERRNAWSLEPISDEQAKNMDNDSNDCWFVIPNQEVSTARISLKVRNIFIKYDLEQNKIIGTSVLNPGAGFLVFSQLLLIGYFRLVKG